MKFYDIDSVFTFGKYEGMTIAEVYEKDPKYLKYCEENIDEFYVSPSVMRELKSMNRAINDSALLDANFDKMSDDEIDEFISGHDEEDEFDESKLERDFDWDNNDLRTNSMKRNSTMSSATALMKVSMEDLMNCIEKNCSFSFLEANLP